MTFTGFGSYHKVSYDYGEYSYSIQCVLNILMGIMTSFKYQKVWCMVFLLLTKEFESYSSIRKIAYS